MEELSQSARKWNGFVCPDCRHVFRVARDHDGKGVVCPSCHRMMRLPDGEDEVPPLVIPGQAAAHGVEDHLELLTSEPDESGMVKKRRRSKRNEEEIFDETFAHKTEVSPKMVRALIGSVALCGAILLVALLWPTADAPDSDGSLPLGIGNNEPEKDEIEIKAERSVVRPMLVENELLPVYLKFLEAESPEEMVRWVRHPEVTLPRMKKFYGEEIRPTGFSSIIWGNRPERIGDAIKVSIQDGEYREREIFAVNEDGWKIDWESWAGWSEMSWEELRKSRTTDPVFFRVVVSDVSYYNFSFADESQWSSYRLESPDGEQSIFGYVPRAGELDARLKSLEGIEERLFILRLSYPDEGPADNQVVVEEIIADGWLAPDDPS